MSKRFPNNHHFLETARGKLRSLGTVTRWSDTPTIVSETVAAHSWYVAVYAYAIAEHLKEEMPEFHIDVEQVLKKAILHDIEEAVTGDQTVNACLLHEDAKQYKDILAAAGRQELFDKFPPNSAATDDMRIMAQFAKDKSLEGRIVAIADYLAAWAFCQDEIDSGNGFNFIKETDPHDSNLGRCIKKLYDAVDGLEVFGEDVRDCVGKFLGDEERLWTRGGLGRDPKLPVKEVAG